MAPNATNYAEIQNDEIEALRSIYMDDFLEHDIKPGAWNVGNKQLFDFISSADLAFPTPPCKR